MTPWLKSLEISNFRSIHGGLKIPLEGSIVLIHGPNATGKTSVLSAIELALTGRLAALARTEPDYEGHLLHRGAQGGFVKLSVNGSEAEPRLLEPADIALTPSGFSGRPLLDGNLRSHFTERCYLPQQSLGRLLELYQHSQGNGVSPLTFFIRELLQLDQLESLILGIHGAAGDIRRTRKLVPDYERLEELVERLKSQIGETTRQIQGLDKELESLDANLRGSFATLGLAWPALNDADEQRSRLAADVEEPLLREFARRRRDLDAIADRLRSTQQTPEAQANRDAVDAARSARVALEEWSAGHGGRTQALMDHAADLLGVAPPIASSVSLPSLEDLLTRVAAQRKRTWEAIERDDACVVQLKEVDESIAKAEAEVIILQERLSTAAMDLSGAAQVLLIAQAHAHSNICPVCERDYTEVSETSLPAFIAARAAALSRSSADLDAARVQLASTQASLSSMRFQRSSLEGQKLSQPNRAELKLRHADLIECERQLFASRSTVEIGQELEATVGDSLRRTAVLAARQDVATESRRQLEEVARSVEDTSQEGETTEVLLTRLRERVLRDEERVSQEQRVRRQALAEYDLLIAGRARRTALSEELAGQRTRLEGARAALEKAKSIVDDGKRLAESARDVRAAIVGRVFNDKLNRLWRDLFVRLAPAEPFVPAFRLPDTTKGPVTAQFETVHRDGGPGGAPGAMLSSGNLNTAALTLFLALHLSVRSHIPCILLDDPVQSMDEVHIAQFTALLRTLVREQARQVVIAVHERPLFEYLRLELSPAIESERLITVELRRSHAGTTDAEINFCDWRPETVTTAA